MEENTTTTSNGEVAAPDTNLFSQDDLNRIVGERLHKERAKMTAELSSREEELMRREYQFAARDALTKRGYASEALDILTVLKAGTIDELNAALDVLEKHVPMGGEQFDAAVRDALNKKLMQATPGTRHSQPGNGVREAFGLKT